MREFAALLKAQFIVQFSGKTGNMKKWVVYLIVFAAFLPILASVAASMYMLGTGAAAGGVLAETFSVCLFAVQIVIIMLGMVSLLNSVYFSTDNEILLGLPLKPHVIFLSKLFMVYLNELMLASIMCLAIFVPFGIGAGVSVLFYFFLPVIILVVPLLPLLLATLLSVPLMYVVSFFKKRAALSSVVSIALFAVAFGAYMIGAGGIGGDAENINILDPELYKTIALAISGAGRAIHPDFVLAKAIFAGSAGEFILNFAIAVGLLAALLAITLVIANLCYNRSIALLETPRNQKNKDLDFKEDGNIVFTLIKKEWTQLIKDPGVALYCLLQVILMPLMTVVLSISFAPVLQMEGIEMNSAFVKNLLVIIFMILQVFFVVAMNMTSATCITRENRNFFIMKVIPVSFETQIKAKAYFGSIVNTVALLISNIAMAIVFGTNVFYTILAFIFLCILGHAFSLVVTGLDLKKPRLNWQTVTEGLKNNSAQLFGMLYSLVAFVVLIALCGGAFYLYTILNSELVIFTMWVVLILLALGLLYLCQKALFKDLDKKFEAIEE